MIEMKKDDLSASIPEKMRHIQKIANDLSDKRTIRQKYVDNGKRNRGHVGCGGMNAHELIKKLERVENKDSNVFLQGCDCHLRVSGVLDGEKDGYGENEILITAYHGDRRHKELRFLSKAKIIAKAEKVIGDSLAAMIDDLNEMAGQ